jgi:hypothetical protein
MNRDVYGELTGKLTETAAAYTREIEGGELQAYVVGLARFAPAVALAAVDAVPLVFPAVFPTADELAGLCEWISADQELSRTLTDELAMAADCDHDYQFEAEPEGGLYSGFDVCRKCKRARPRFNPKAAPNQFVDFEASGKRRS